MFSDSPRQSPLQESSLLNATAFQSLSASPLSADLTDPLQSSFRSSSSALVRHGDTLSAATNLGTLSGSSSTIGAIDSIGDIDFFRFTLSSTSNLSASLTGLTADADVEVIRDGNFNGTVDAGEIIRGSYWGGSISESINLQGLGAGTYYIRALPFGSAVTNYTLGLTATAGSGVAAELNNTLGTAHDLGTLNGNRSFSGYVGSSDTNDFYRFSLGTTTNISLSLNGLSADADLQILRDADFDGLIDPGEILSGSYSGGSLAESISLQGLGSGNYFVRVLQYSGNTNYTLNLNGYPGLGWATESNNSIAQAYSLGNLSGDRAFTGYVGSSDTDDYYSFTLDTTSTVNLNLSGLSVGSDVDLYLYNSAGASIDSSNFYNNANEAISRVLNPGTYYVRADQYSGSSNYNLNFSATPRIADWTFMVYMAADNNLEAAGIDDFLEMAAIGSTANVNIVVQFDRATGYDTSYGNWTGTRRGLVSAGNTPTASWGTDLGEVNMGSSASLSSFIDWGMSNYQARNYATVIWNHGGGWNYIAGDDANSDHLTANEVSNAFSRFSGVTDGVDLIGADACLMGMVEFAHQIRNYGSVFVGSEENEPNDGWTYDTILSDLRSHSSWTAAQLGTAIVNRSTAASAGIPTMSAIDLRDIGTLSSRISSLATTIMSSSTATDRSRIQTHRTNSSYFGDLPNPMYNYRDLGTFLSSVAGDYLMSSGIRTAASTALSAYNNAIIANHSAAGEGATGLSIYFQPRYGSVDSQYTSTNSTFAADTQWDEFLNWWA